MIISELKKLVDDLVDQGLSDLEVYIDREKLAIRKPELEPVSMVYHLDDLIVISAEYFLPDKKHF